MKIIRLSEFVPSRWQNGGGTTREISQQTIALTLRWRLSLADIDHDGPFSAFPGYARITMTVAGAGLDLSIDNVRHQIEPFAPQRFLGEQAVVAHLTRGPTRQLNLSYLPDSVRARFASLDALEVPPPRDPQAHTERFCIALEVAQVRSSISGTSPLVLEVFDTVRLDTSDPLRFDAATRVAVCDIAAKGPYAG